jgi:hypothetical protein
MHNTDSIHHHHILAEFKLFNMQPINLLPIKCAGKSSPLRKKLLVEEKGKLEAKIT